MSNEAANYLIEFYLSLIAYYVLHMIFVIASDFIEAFSIPPLNIGIYIDKLAAIRALLMVTADALEFGFLDKVAEDRGRGHDKLIQAGTGTQATGYDTTGYALIVLGAVLVLVGMVGAGVTGKPLEARLAGILGVGGIAVLIAGIVVVGQATSSTRGASPRRIGSIVSFIAMLACRLVYLWLVYNSDNKSLSVFITLCLEGFWFGFFQMSFFAIGPKYNAVTSLGIHTMGNFIFAIESILNRVAKISPSINSLYKVRVHAWTVVVTSVIALGLWLWFCLQVDAEPSALKDTLKNQLKSGDNNLNALKQSDGQDKVAKALQAEFGKVTGGSNVTVTIVGTKEATSTTTVPAKVTVTVTGTGDTGTASVELKNGQVNVDSGTSVTVTFSSVGGVKVKSAAHARRMAYKFLDALASLEVIVEQDTGGSKVTVTKAEGKFVKALNEPGGSGEAKGDPNHSMSPFWLFIVGAFAEDFSVPGILPFAFLDPEKANLVNYLTPSFFMTGASVIVFFNDVFAGGAAGTAGAGEASWPDWDFKAWSEGEAPGWNWLWALNVPKYVAFFIAMFGIHGIEPRLRCIVQCRWRVMLLTMFVVVPRAILEVAGYVGVANYAILAGDTGDFEGFTMIALHDALAMFCRFAYGKLAVGYK